MAQPTNTALYLPTALSPTMTVAQAPYPSPAHDEVIIKTTAVAINPADWILQRTGALLSTYPAILGCDVAGVVREVGASLTERYQIGDRVFGAANPLEGNRSSAFQEVMVLKDPYIAKVPVGATRGESEMVVVLPLGINTAASCLFGRGTLGLDLAREEEGRGKNVVVVVWGASSSVGACGVQLARMAGYEVVAVAGKSNVGMVKGLGARECVDYMDEGVVEKIVEAVGGREVAGALDAISKEETVKRVCEILARCGGETRRTVVAVKPGAEEWAEGGVEVKTNFGVDQKVFRETVGARLWKDLLPAALDAGEFLCKPDAEVVGHGLGDIQKAVDLLAEHGVSAKKLVVTL